MTTKGKITVRRMNLMGFTPTNQVWIIENGGGKGSVPTFHWLRKHSRFFNHSLFCGRTYHTLVAPRLAKFKEYATAQGFEVVEGFAA